MKLRSYQVEYYLASMSDLFLFIPPLVRYSFGTRLILHRLKVNKELFNSNFVVNIIDKMTNGRATGTRVELSLEGQANLTGFTNPSGFARHQIRPDGLEKSVRTRMLESGI